MKLTKGRNGGTLKTLEPGDTLPGSGHPGGNNFKTVAKRYLDSTYDKNNLLTGKKDKLTGMELLCLSLIDKALKGDVTAAREILDRIEGKVSQANELKIFNELTDEQADDIINRLTNKP